MTKRKTKPSRTPRSEWQRKRDDALAAKGYTKRDVWHELQRRGFAYSEPTVRAVLSGRHRNDDVAAAFCALAGVSAVDAFPLDEPRHGARPGASPRMTKTKRAALLAAAAAQTSDASRRRR